MSNFDAIIVPGGGVRSGGELPTWVKRRLDRALEVRSGEYLLTQSAGTPHRPPPLDPHGFPIFESVAMARYLIAAGVPEERILTETCSYDTIGNAFFARVLHVDVLRWRRLLVINSDFHIERTKAVFDWVFGLTPQTSRYELDYESVSDPLMPEEVFVSRVQRERRSLEQVRALSGQLRTLPAFHNWLFTEHSAYCARRRAPVSLNGALASY